MSANTYFFNNFLLFRHIRYFMAVFTISTKKYEKSSQLEPLQYLL